MRRLLEELSSRRMGRSEGRTQRAQARSNDRLLPGPEPQGTVQMDPR